MVDDRVESERLSARLDFVIMSMIKRVYDNLYWVVLLSMMPVIPKRFWRGMF